VDELFQTIYQFLNRSQPTEIIILSTIAAITVLLWRALGRWQKVRTVQAKLSLQQELLRRGLPAAEVERLFRLAFPDPNNETLLSSGADDESLNRIVRSLAVLKCDAAELQEMTAYLGVADSKTRQGVAEALDGLFDAKGVEPTRDQALAIIRGLCGVPQAESTVGQS
jgi:hypothetical protein